MARFLAVGDLHLDAGSELGVEPGERLREQEAVWQRCLEVASEQGCDAILFAGDAFDKPRPTPDALLSFLLPLKRSPFKGERTIAVLGNHDVASVRSGTGLGVFHTAGLLRLAAVPEVREIAGAAVCCLPWVSASRLVASQGGGDRDDVNAYAAELLVATARGLREKAGDLPAILLTHFSISGSALPNGLPVDQLREPVLSYEALDELGFDAIVAGHIHAPQVFGRDETPAFYVGSPMPLNFGEAGTDHGVWILELDSAVSGTWVPRFVPIASRKLVTLVYPDVRYEVEPPDVTDAVVKVKYHATQDEARRLDVAALKRALIEGGGAHKVYAVELDVERQERARVQGLTDDLDEISSLDLWIEAVELEAVNAAVLRDRATRYIEAVR